MNIECIVCDLDETLLNDEEKIDDKAVDFLINMQKEGSLLILASGRSYKRMIKYAELLHMYQYNGILIDSNGTSILNLYENNRNRLSSLNKNNIEEIFNILRDKNIEIQFNLDDTIYVYLSNEIYDLKKKIRTEMRLPIDYPWTGGAYSWFSDMREGYPYSKLIENLDEVPQKINKITLIQDDTYIEQLATNLRNNDILTNYSFVKTSERTLEIMKKDVSKGNALRKIMKEKNLSSKKVFVFGNAENDISMFECTHNSYVVGNAPDYVKRYANYVTDTNNNNGVYNALRKLKELDKCKITEKISDNANGNC